MKLGHFKTDAAQLKTLFGLDKNTVITEIEFDQISGEIKLITCSNNEIDAWIEQGKIESSRRKAFGISMIEIDGENYFKII